MESNSAFSPTPAHTRQPQKGRSIHCFHQRSRFSSSSATSRAHPQRTLEIIRRRSSLVAVTRLTLSRSRSVFLCVSSLRIFGLFMLLFFSQTTTDAKPFVVGLRLSLSPRYITSSLPLSLSLSPFGHCPPTPRVLRWEDKLCPFVEWNAVVFVDVSELCGEV